MYPSLTSFHIDRYAHEGASDDDELWELRSSPPSSCPYSPNVREEVFSEVRIASAQ
jgi:hypothetical protein